MLVEFILRILVIIAISNSVLMNIRNKVIEYYKFDAYIRFRK